MEANLPPQPTAGGSETSPDAEVAAANKKFKIAAIAAGVLAVLAIGLAVWGFSTKSDLDTANKKLAVETNALGSDSAKLAAAKAAYVRARRALTQSEADDGDLEAELKQETSEYNSAKAEAESADSQEAKTQAEEEATAQQLAAAQACAKGAVAAINKLFDEQASGSGTSGTIDKLTALQTQCQSAIND